MKRFVWLNLNSGQFSNSWTEAEHGFELEELVKDAKKDSGWKLIEYACHNDEDFEFFNCMKLR